MPEGRAGGQSTVHREVQATSDLPRAFSRQHDVPGKTKTTTALHAPCPSLNGGEWLDVLPCSHLRLVSVTTNQIAKVRNSRYRASHVTLCVSLRAGRPRAGDSDTTRSASRFQNVERRSHRRARRRSPRAASNANFVDCKFDRAVEIDSVVFLLHRRGLVGEKRFESKRPIFGTVLPGSAL